MNRNELPPVAIPAGYNYIGVFLTFACNLCCSYCINRFGSHSPAKVIMSGEEWARGLNRLVSRPDLPVTLQGGEPTLHPDFFAIVNTLNPDLNVDLLTNLEFDSGRFMAMIPPERIRRAAPYASIRVSFHPEAMRIEPLAAKVEQLQSAGYSVGIWGVLHPDHELEVLAARDYSLSRGIDFRTKEFLGAHDGVLHGSYRYPDACSGRRYSTVRCRTTELIIGPGGDIFRCHGDLYDGRTPVGNILDPDLVIDTGFRSCDKYGFCNPCDVKLKTNRFQEFGHTSVEIVAEPSIGGGGCISLVDDIRNLS